MKNKKIIGENLSSLIEKFSKTDVISNIERNYNKENVFFVSNEIIEDNNFVKDSKFKEDDLNYCVISLKENGFYSPLVIRKKDSYYEVILGRKRLIASKKMGTINVPVILNQLNDEETLLTILADIRESRNINYYELSSILNILKNNYSYKLKDLSIVLNQSISQVSNIIQLKRLNSAILEGLNEFKISFGHAKALIRLNENDSIFLYNKIIEKHLSVRELEKEVYSSYLNKKISFNDKTKTIKLAFSSKEKYDKSLDFIKKSIDNNDIYL